MDSEAHEQVTQDYFMSLYRNIQAKMKQLDTTEAEELVAAVQAWLDAEESNECE